VGFTTARQAWSIERNGRTYRVEMEDEYFFGRRVVRVNGTVVHSGRTVLSDHSGAYQFDLAGETAFLKISTNGFRYYYDLVTQPSLHTASREGPRELAQEPPSLTGIVALVVFALAMAAALALLADGRLWREPVVAVAGVQVDAIVTRAATTTSDARRIEYRFQVGAESFTHEAFISRERYERARSLGVVPVRYLEVAPQVSAFVPEPGDLLFDALFGLVLAAEAGSFLVTAARTFGDYRIWKRLSTTGVDTVGRVTRVHTLRNRYMAAVGCAFEYAYTAASSSELRGHSGRFALDAVMHYPVGSPVRIRYDPNRPGDSILLTPSV
jgi:uncharacterized protein DUF3592/FAIM1 (Fas apoptotic inhibitory molecule) protein